MNTIEFTEWLKEQGCSIKEIPGDSRKYMVKITGPAPYNGHLYFSAPATDRPVKCYTMCNICDQLNLNVPESCGDHVKLAELIKGKYY